jgi:hypothetical protein
LAVADDDSSNHCWFLAIDLRPEEDEWYRKEMAQRMLRRGSAVVQLAPLFAAAGALDELGHAGVS